MPRTDMMKEKGLTLVDAINEALYQEMERDDRVVCLGEDVGLNGGVFRVTDGLHARFGPRRVWDAPIAESGMIGLAIGLALAGHRPICEIQFSGFLPPAYDQLRNHAARFRSRTRGRRPCPLLVRAPNGGGIGAPESHGESLEALLAATPGLKVVVPGDPRAARGLLLAALADPDPVVFLEPTALYFAHKAPVPAADPFPWRLGQSYRRRPGRDLTLVTYGAGLPRALAAAERAAAFGVDAEIIDTPTLAPLDHRPIAASLARTGRLVITHDGPAAGGLAAELLARLHDDGCPPAAYRRVTAPDVPHPYPGHEAICCPTTEHLADVLVELAGPRRRLRVAE